MTCGNTFWPKVQKHKSRAQEPSQTKLEIHLPILVRDKSQLDKNVNCENRSITAICFNQSDYCRFAANYVCLAVKRGELISKLVHLLTAKLSQDLSVSSAHKESVATNEAHR